ncbi:MAG: hypothetical protein IT427_12990 [Pirellulales bacterium]|nr:hypothetical protein [Pirellulales bacterium]
MASPFKAFRKNQKLMMALITILAMFGFVFVGPWTKFGGESNGPKNPDAFKWKYGTVTKRELQSAQMSRFSANQFLIEAAIKSGMPAQEAGNRIASLFPARRQGDIEYAMLLAKRAEQVGLTVSDDAINAFLRNWTRGKLSDPEIAQIVHSIPYGNGRLDQTVLFDTLRWGLEAVYAGQAFMGPLNRQTMYGPIFAGDTPAERWRYYCQVNRKATAEIYPVVVADFLSEIPDPTESVLQQFYEQHKDKEPDPRTGEPAFKLPYRAKFQYFKANFDQLVAEEKPKIAEQEIKDYYETNKDRDFRKKQLPDLPPLGEQPDKNATSATPSASDSNAPAAGEVGRPEQHAGEEQKSAPAAEKNPEPAAPDAKQPDAKKADSSPAETKSSSDSEQNSKAPADTKSSSLRQSFTLDGEQLVLADELLLAQETKASETIAPNDKSSEGTAEETNSSDSKPAEAKPADANSHDPKAAESKTPDTQSPDTKIPDTAAIPPVEYEPLEKVADDIRKRIAEQKVDERIQKAFAALAEQMNKYRSDSARARALGGEKPTALDFAALAKEYRLEAKETDLISFWQALNGTDLGKSHTFGAYNAPSFGEVAFGTHPVPTFEPKETMDIDRNLYLWWKVADEQARVPPLADIRAEVVKAWKMIEARKPAKKKAEEIAEQVRKANQPLRDVLAGREVATAGPFSWLDRNLGQIPVISKVNGVEDPGSEFMRMVFSLDPQGAGVAPNETQSTYYVVQVEKLEPSMDELETGFMTAMSSPMILQTYAFVGARDHRADALGWYEDLQKHFEYQSIQGEEPQEANSEE